MSQNLLQYMQDVQKDILGVNLSFIPEIWLKPQLQNIIQWRENNVFILGKLQLLPQLLLQL